MYVVVSRCCQINEAVVHREQLLLIPNVADRKRLLLQLLQRNNVTLRQPPLPSPPPLALRVEEMP
jgi:hypothetical protein